MLIFSLDLMMSKVATIQRILQASPGGRVEMHILGALLLQQISGFSLQRFGCSKMTDLLQHERLSTMVLGAPFVSLLTPSV